MTLPRKQNKKQQKQQKHTISQINDEQKIKNKYITDLL